MLVNTASDTLDRMGIIWVVELSVPTSPGLPRSLLLPQLSLKGMPRGAARRFVIPPFRDFRNLHAPCR